MKFKSLEIQNLASLQGKHHIDFSDKELIAITGATGSGKSTILNAITLALYGELYKKSLHQNDLINLNSTFASICLTFIFEGKNYQADWSARLSKKSGEPLKNPIYKRTLKCEDEILDINGSDLFGLTFSEFCQTIVLHQGEFSKFLISSPAEKRQLLEKVFKMTHYSSFATNVRTALKEIDYEKRIVQNSLEQLPENLIKTLDSVEKKNSELSKKIELLRKTIKANQLQIKNFEQSQQTKNLFTKKEQDLNKLQNELIKQEQVNRRNKDSLLLLKTKYLSLIHI